MSPNHNLDLIRRLQQIRCRHQPVKTHYYSYTCKLCGFVSDKPMNGINLRHVWWFLTNRLPGYIVCIHDWFQDVGGIAGVSKKCTKCGKLEVWEEGKLVLTIDPLNDMYVGHWPDLVLEDTKNRYNPIKDWESPVGTPNAQVQVHFPPEHEPDNPQCNCMRCH